ncbi:iron uptake porin [Spirulina subsalsa]|uniref:iron uptake porin n=1 Tax=Spirulina subsalsa TaxID=54311 RepID=UPI000311ACB6|nr:iron uptake porin [Spirulina subsalsa]
MSKFARYLPPSVMGRLGTLLLGLGSGAIAFSPLPLFAQNLEDFTLNSAPMSQMNSVSGLRDVSPGDWAFSALQGLIERYGCLVGYPDGTFRGQRPLSRYEFAAGLNACLEQIQRILAASTADFVTREDLNLLERLLKEFESELVTLGTRVDHLESRTAFLEDNQFSTTTKLRGEAIFALTDVLTGSGTTSTFPAIFGRTGQINVPTPTQNPIFGNRVRLDFLTSFSGQDELKIRLTSGNLLHPNRPVGPVDPGQPRGLRYGPSPLRGFQGGSDFSPEGQQTFNNIGSLPGNNTLGLTQLSYKFPLSQQTQLVIMGFGGEHHDYVPTTFSFWDDDNGGTGSLSLFGQRSAIYNFEGAGLGFSHHFSDRLSFSAGYLASYANDPTRPQPDNPFSGGLFDGRYSALAQLTVQPSDNFSFGLTYSYSRHNVGGPVASLPIFFGDQGTTLANFPVIPSQESRVNSYGIAALWEISPKFAVNGWFAYNRIKTSGGTLPLFFGGTPYSGSSADVLTYGVSLAFPDLGGPGHLGGLVVGASPYATRAKVPEPFRTGNNWFGSNLGEDFTDLIAGNTVPWHIEGFYRYKMTDQIFITPGLIWLTAPNQTSRNPSVLIGTLRLTFLF